MCEELLISPPELCDWNWSPETPVWIRSETLRLRQWVKDLWEKLVCVKKTTSFLLTELLSYENMLCNCGNHLQHQFNNLCWLQLFTSSHVLSTNVNLWEFVSWGGKMWVIDQPSWTVGLMLVIRRSSLEQEWISSSTTVSQTVCKICVDLTSEVLCGLNLSTNHRTDQILDHCVWFTLWSCQVKGLIKVWGEESAPQCICSELWHCVNYGDNKLIFGSGTKLTVHISKSLKNLFNVNINVWLWSLF